MTLTATDTDLGARIDELSERVDHLTRLIEADRMARAATSDLVTEAMPLARMAYERIADRLDASSVDIDAVTSLVLKLGEMAPDLERTLDTVQTVTALVDEVGGLSADAFALLVDQLTELERRGYFAWIKGGLEVVDRIITEFDEDDIAALGDNVVLIFETIKEMTQPDVMRMLQRSARMVREDAELDPPKLSMFRLFKEMRDPDVKLGIHRMLMMLRGMAMSDSQAAETTTEHSAKEE